VARQDPDGVAAWAALLRTHAAVVPLLDRALEPSGLPLSWYDVLLELNAAPGRRLTMGQLGERAVLSRSRVSRVVDELCRAGLLEREANPADRRSAYAVITPVGRRRLRAAAPVYLGAIDQHFARHLSGAERRAIAGGLSKVLDAEEQRS
jgi:DNA-binding MarR family transcriptional regulator